MFYFLSQETASSGFFFRECLYLSTYAFTRFATFAELTSPLLLWQTYNSFEENKHFWKTPVNLPLFHIICLPDTPSFSISGRITLKSPSTFPIASLILPNSHSALSNKKWVMFWELRKLLWMEKDHRYFCFSCSPSQELPAGCSHKIKNSTPNPPQPKRPRFRLTGQLTLSTAFRTISLYSSLVMSLFW